MHLLNLNKIAVSLAVGTALVASWYPANLNAITSATPYPAPVAETENRESPAEAPASEGPAQADDQQAVGEGAAATPKPAAAKPDPLDIWLERLAHYESNNRAHIKILDVNGKYSYGCLQFQEGTFRTYALKYSLISRSTPTESVIYDCALQKKIAKLMIKENYYNWQAWYTSVHVKNLGLPPKI